MTLHKLAQVLKGGKGSGGFGHAGRPGKRGGSGGKRGKVRPAKEVTAEIRKILKDPKHKNAIAKEAEKVGRSLFGGTNTGSGFFFETPQEFIVSSPNKRLRDDARESGDVTVQDQLRSGSFIGDFEYPFIYDTKTKKASKFLPYNAKSGWQITHEDVTAFNNDPKNKGKVVMATAFGIVDVFAPDAKPLKKTRPKTAGLSLKKPRKSPDVPELAFGKSGILDFITNANKKFRNRMFDRFGKSNEEIRELRNDYNKLRKAEAEHPEVLKVIDKLLSEEEQRFL